MSEGIDIERPAPRPTQTTSHTGSFHSRALAASAAHRYRRPSNQRSKSDHLTPRLQAKTNSHVDLPKLPKTFYSPANSPPSPGSGFLSPKHRTSKGPRSPALSSSYSHSHVPYRSLSTISGSSSQSGDPEYSWLGAGGGTGDEPGVDVKSRRDEEAWGHLTGETKVTVLDYTSDPEGNNIRVEFEGDRLKEWLSSEEAQKPAQEDGQPKGVRWIHVDGLNWEVVKTLTLEFGLHPLAVEDALRATNSPRSKLDFYKNHLYLQILVQHTHPGDEQLISESVDDISSWHLPGENPSVMADPPSEGMGYGATSTTRRDSVGDALVQSGRKLLRLPEGVEGVFEPMADPSRGSRRAREGYSKNAHRLTVDELSAKYMVPIRRSIMSAFLTRDGTLITLTRKTIREVLHPVYARLEDEASLLRRSGDVSMLAQALLDITADLAIEISQTFESEILKLEASVLVEPSIETVRHLHVLSSQLIRLRRSLTPLLHVAYIIRDQDVARAAAASAMTTGPRPGDKNHGSRDSQWLAGSTPAEGHHSIPIAPNSMAPMAPMAALSSSIPSISAPTRPATPTARAPFGQSSMSQNNSMNGSNGLSAMGAMGTAQGFFSPMTKVYIGDVLDHLEIIVSNMDQFVATCDHLTDYVFNVLSFQTNESMERLSIVTVVFLPLTFIASYFGMNFTEFPSLENPDSYFWKVAAPATVGFFVIFSWGYLKIAVETFLRKIGRWRVIRSVELRRRKKRV